MAFFTDEFWDFAASVAPKVDLARRAHQIAKLDRVQIDLSRRPRLAPALVAMLRDKVFSVRPGLPLRLYGCDNTSALDLSFLEELPMIEELDLEVEGRLDNVQALALATRLRALCLVPPKNVDSNLLRHVPPGVSRLRVMAAHGGTLDLEPIAHLKSLTELVLYGYGTNLAALLPKLTKLRRLELRTIKGLASLEPIAGLTKLQQVVLYRGKYAQLDVLTKLPALRYLKLSSLPALASVDVVSRLTQLEGVCLDAMNTVTRFPDVTQLTRLRIVKLAGMKALRDFSALQHAPALEEFVHQKVSQQRPEDYLPVLRNRTLKRAGVGFSKKADVQQMTALIEQAGIDGQVFMYPQVRGRFAEKGASVVEVLAAHRAIERVVGVDAQGLRRREHGGARARAQGRAEHDVDLARRRAGGGQDDLVDHRVEVHRGLSSGGKDDGGGDAGGIQRLGERDRDAAIDGAVATDPGLRARAVRGRE